MFPWLHSVSAEKDFRTEEILLKSSVERRLWASDDTRAPPRLPFAHWKLSIAHCLCTFHSLMVTRFSLSWVRLTFLEATELKQRVQSGVLQCYVNKPLLISPVLVFSSTQQNYILLPAVTVYSVRSQITFLKADVYILIPLLRMNPMSSKGW